MAKYALVDDNRITQVMVAEDESSLGTIGLLFEVVNIDNLDPEPSRDWERVNGVWIPPLVPEDSKALWNGAGFGEVAELEAPEEADEEEEEDDK